MKTCTVLLAIVLVLTLASCSTEEETPKVLLFVRDGSMDLEFMLTEEAGVMKDVLEQAGFEVAVATMSGEPIEAGSSSLKPDLKLGDVIVADYAGFILPCMAVDDLSNPIPDEEAVAMVKKAAAEGKPVAAQLGSVLTLAEAGVLQGRKYAFADEEGYKAGLFPSLEGAVYGGTGVVEDGTIITSGMCPFMASTSGKPDGTEELTRALIDAMEAKTN